MRHTSLCHWSSSAWVRESVHSTRPVHPLRNVHLLTPADCLFVFLDCLYVTVRVKVAACWLAHLCFKLNEDFSSRESKWPRDHFKVTMATLQIKPEMLQTNQSLCFQASLHGGEDRVARPGGLSLIIGSCARDCTRSRRAFVRRWKRTRGLHHPIHHTSSPSWQQCEVFLSRTQTANSNPWLAATLLSVTNTGPIYPSNPPPPSPAVGTPHNGSVATVTDISMLLMFTVVLCIVCWYPRRDLHKRETNNQSIVVPLCLAVCDPLSQTNMFHILSERPFICLTVKAQQTKKPLHLMTVSLWG